MNKKTKQILSFLIRFQVLLLLFYIYLYYLKVDTSFLEKIEVSILSYLFGDSIKETTSFYHDSFTYAVHFIKEGQSFLFVVDRDCLGINISILLAIFIISYPPNFSNFKIRVLFILSYFLIVEVLNILRLIFLFYLFKYHLEFYSLFHDLIWQVSNVILVFSLLFVYIKYNNIIKNKLCLKIRISN